LWASIAAIVSKVTADIGATFLMHEGDRCPEKLFFAAGFADRKELIEKLTTQYQYCEYAINKISDYQRVN